MSRETIYTIPINDVFSDKCGCPICKMRDMLESRGVEYIMGAAMMEPDIRIETNKYGFCETHFDMMLKQKNRLSLALMLETHLDETVGAFPYNPKKGGSAADSCYICLQLDSAMKKMLATASKLYFSSPEFKAMLESQEYFCLPHYELFCTEAAVSLPKKQAAELVRAITDIVTRYAKTLRENVHSFTEMYDYRNAGKTETDKNIVNSIENAVGFLIGKDKNKNDRENLK